ncbi:MAG TPA: hypothetical protein VFH37_00980, partial [Candidatus Saccharimonadales bacterium]|nr:hypothetical protein [Candidatus Saccharimonadales bacterium]
GIIGWAAFAAPHKPGSGGGSGTISLVMVTDQNGDGLPNYNDVVTFAVSTSSTTQPYVTVKCSQNGNLVYQQSSGIFATSLNQNFTLGKTTAWQGGAADCTATLQNWDNFAKRGTKGIIDITSITFHVNA